MPAPLPRPRRWARCPRPCAGIAPSRTPRTRGPAARAWSRGRRCARAQRAGRGGAERRSRRAAAVIRSSAVAPRRPTRRDNRPGLRRRRTRRRSDRRAPPRARARAPRRLVRARSARAPRQPFPSTSAAPGRASAPPPRSGPVAAPDHRRRWHRGPRRSACPHARAPDGARRLPSPHRRHQQRARIECPKDAVRDFAALDRADGCPHDHVYAETLGTRPPRSTGVSLLT